VSLAAIAVGLLPFGRPCELFIDRWAIQFAIDRLSHSTAALIAA
jgi:hypothetical protein